MGGTTERFSDWMKVSTLSPDTTVRVLSLDADADCFVRKELSDAHGGAVDGDHSKLDCAQLLHLDAADPYRVSCSETC
jgi:hypothetical protein